MAVVFHDVLCNVPVDAIRPLIIDFELDPTWIGFNLSGADHATEFNWLWLQQGLPGYTVRDSISGLQGGLEQHFEQLPSEWELMHGDCIGWWHSAASALSSAATDAVPFATATGFGISESGISWVSGHLPAAAEAVVPWVKTGILTGGFTLQFRSSRGSSSNSGTAAAAAAVAAAALAHGTWGGSEASSEWPWCQRPDVLPPCPFFRAPQVQRHRLKSKECWNEQFFPELCCMPPRGFPTCFGGPHTYANCCGAVRTFLPEPPWPQLLPLAAGLRVEPRPSLSVDLVVRSFHGDWAPLEMLLLSIAVFWPFHRLNTRVAAVLDAEAAETPEFCARVLRRFRAFTHCFLEELPPWWQRGRHQPKRPQAARVHWSTFWSDHYARRGVSYVGVVDSDVVFHSFNADALLFAPSEAQAAKPNTQHHHQTRGGGALPRPVVIGRWSPSFSFSAFAVQDEFPQTSFMDSLPMVIHREDLGALREHVRQRFARLTKKPMAFDEAFVVADQQVDMHAASEGWFLGYHGEFLCFQAVMGAFLWRWRRESYFFSIKDGLGLAIPSSATCPSLRPAIHLSELKRRAQRARNVSYQAEARGIMAAGLCEAEEARGRLSGSDVESCSQLPYSADDLLRRADDIAGTWSSRASGHCGHRRLSNLLRQHRALLAETLDSEMGSDASGVFSAGAIRRTLRWAVHGNASGMQAYLNTPPASDSACKRLEILDGGC